MEYDVMKKFQKLFDEASKNGKIGELVIQKTANAGESYLTKKNENSWLKHQGDNHYGMYSLTDGNVKYGIQLTDWRGGNNFYVMVFDYAGKSDASLEINVMDKNLLVWKYIPRKQDKKNDLRKAIFSKYYPDCSVVFEVPNNIDELKIFCEKIMEVAAIKKKAASLMD